MKSNKNGFKQFIHRESFTLTKHLAVCVKNFSESCIIIDYISKSRSETFCVKIEDRDEVEVANWAITKKINRELIFFFLLQLGTVK
jgi:hypothetical protein